MKINNQNIYDFQLQSHAELSSQINSINNHMKRSDIAHDIGALFSVVSCMLIMFYLWRERIPKKHGVKK